MFRLTVLLVVVAVAQAKLYNGPRVPVSIQNQFQGKTGGRIIGGEEVKPNSIPFQVSFQTSGGFHFCGGSVYNEDTVITAAHCCDGSSASSVKIVAGDHDLFANEGPEQTSKVSKIIMHEDYDSSDISSDICLLKLSNPLELNAEVAGVKLPAATDEFPAGTPSTVSGWGVIDSGSSPDVLYAVDVQIDSDEDCESGYGSGYIPKHHICASARGKDSCQGDSGGPLTCGDDRVLCGIVSWGYGCAEPGYPGVYSRTTTYVDWIAANL